MIGGLILGGFFIWLGWRALTRGSEPRNSYESLKRDVRKYFGVVWLLMGIVSVWYGMSALVAPTPTVVRKVVRKAKKRITTPNPLADEPNEPSVEPDKQ